MPSLYSEQVSMQTNKLTNQEAKEILKKNVLDIILSLINLQQLPESNALKNYACI